MAEAHEHVTHAKPFWHKLVWVIVIVVVLDILVIGGAFALIRHHMMERGANPMMAGQYGMNRGMNDDAGNGAMRMGRGGQGGQQDAEGNENNPRMMNNGGGMMARFAGASEVTSAMYNNNGSTYGYSVALSGTTVEGSLMGTDTGTIASMMQALTAKGVTFTGNMFSKDGIALQDVITVLQKH